MYQQDQFIEGEARTTASNFQWLKSKGTNYDCYLEYENSLNAEGKIGITVDKIRTIVYAISCPLQFAFFYWSLIVFFLHRFNFKKPVMKLILFHFILRCIGDILNKIGNLMPYYFSNEYNKDGITTHCKISVDNPERHPLRWLITRQIGCAFWFTGEMIADWYPLLRTRAVAREKKSIRWVYLTCIIFNCTKVALIVLHFTLPAKDLYNEDGVYDKTKVDLFYFKYWVIQLLIIYSSVTYEIVVYQVLKKSIFEQNYSQYGFLKKFRTMSEYRMLLAAIISIIFLPIVSVTIIIKFFYYIKYSYHDLDFTFDEIRTVIANVPYYMIFIDQIMLIQSRKDTQQSEKSYNKIAYSNNNTSNGNNDISYYNRSYKSAASNSIGSIGKLPVSNDITNEPSSCYKSHKKSLSSSNYLHSVSNINTDVNSNGYKLSSSLLNNHNSNDDIHLNLNSYNYNNNIFNNNSIRNNEYNGVLKEWKY